MSSRSFEEGSAYGEDRSLPAKTLNDYVSVLRRRKKMFGWSALSTFAIAAIVAIVLPSVYRSSSTVLIEEQEIPQDLVRSTVTSYADERIQVISQQVMTRSVLLQLVDKYDLYPRKRRYQTSEEILDRMREDIRLTPVSVDVTDRKSGLQMRSTIAFQLSYDSDSAANAQRIANELTTLFLNENIKNRQEKAAETSTFLQEEADRLQKHISEVEASLSDFKRRNEGRLPDLQSFNTQMVERTDSEIMRIERDMATLRDRKIYLQGQLAQIKPSNPILGKSEDDRTLLDPATRLKSLENQLSSKQGAYSEDHPDIKRLKREIASLKTQIGDTSDNGATQDKRAELQTQLSELRQRYSEDHPDVVKVKRALAALDSKSADRSSSVVAKVQPDNPPYITLSAELESVNSELKSMQPMLDGLHEKMRTFEGRLQQTPGVERDYLELSRDHENSLIRYREVKAKQMQAQVAEQLERDSKAERFSLIDPPQFPERPFSPNRWGIMLAGLFIALIVGLSTVGVTEAMDQTITSRLQLIHIMRAPVLTMVPLVQLQPVVPGQMRRRVFMGMGAAGGALIVALILFNYMVMPLEVAWFAMIRRIPFS